MFPHSEWVRVCVGLAAFTSLASLCLLSPLALTMFHLPQDSLSSEGWDLMEESLSRSKNFIVSLCLHIVHLCGPLCLFSSVSGGRSFNNDLAKTDL